ncbi:GIY-YIG nuclease family protein [Pseudomonas sp.]|uniref:GIY-YIG nuclease family protein n=1 Tax=Pseudomonas sp. TaxID=306 RepID=UPI003C75B863
MSLLSQSLLDLPQEPGSAIATAELPLETRELRRLLDDFLNREVRNPLDQSLGKLGNYRWGVYAFYDYDGEPIYVGQTKESLRTRIRRHLTNQRTDAVAMSVLDPFEVYRIVVYPLPQLETRSANDAQAKELLDALEQQVYSQAIATSKFGAILNEKEPPAAKVAVEVPESFSGIIVSDAVRAIREHPDMRIARRTQTISRLAMIISQRRVQKGLRKVLHVQALRLEWLTRKRFNSASDTVEDD